jgi:hypothetical protein
MAERGRVYLWPRNRSFGVGKPRPVVVLPLSTTAELANNPLAYPLVPSAANGLRLLSYVMTWLPTTVHADHLQGPLGRISAAELKDIATGMVASLDLQCLEPWQPDD